MKYPAIYQSTANGNVILLFSVNQGFVLDKCATIIGKSGKWNEAAFKNITTEYLANTYGEVKSKAHAEFIVKLAEVAKCAGLEVAKHKIANAESFKGIFFNFYNDNGTLWFAFHYEIQAKNRGEKQITIPLPPEREGVAINNDHEFEFVDCTFAGNKINAESEWPKVGDDVVLMSGKGNVVALPDNHGNYVIVTDKGFYLLANKDDIKKPKTPEQELQDSVELIIKESLDEDYSPIANAEHITNEIFGKYNITKKPQ